MRQEERYVLNKGKCVTCFSERVDRTLHSCSTSCTNAALSVSSAAMRCFKACTSAACSLREGPTGKAGVGEQEEEA